MGQVEEDGRGKILPSSFTMSFKTKNQKILNALKNKQCWNVNSQSFILSHFIQDCCSCHFQKYGGIVSTFLQQRNSYWLIFQPWMPMLHFRTFSNTNQLETYQIVSVWKLLIYTCLRKFSRNELFGNISAIFI